MAPCAQRSLMHGLFGTHETLQAERRKCSAKISQTKSRSAGLKRVEQYQDLTQFVRCLNDLPRLQVLRPARHEQEGLKHFVRMSAKRDHKLAARTILGIEPVLYCALIGSGQGHNSLHRRMCPAILPTKCPCDSVREAFRWNG